MYLALAKSFLIDNRMSDRAQYADDYTTTFPDGRALPADLVFSLMQAMISAAPDLAFSAENWREDGDKVLATIHVTGTMTGRLSHPMFGDIEATGKAGRVGGEHVELTFRDGRVAGMVIVDADGPSGPPEMVRQWTTP